MGSVSSSIRLGLLAVGFACGVADAAAAADPVEGLAPPGPCAEPREAISGVSVSNISVVGPLQSFFSPADVAAAPASAARPAPSPVAGARPVACDQPGANCALIPTSIFAQPPIIPGDRPGSTSPSTKRKPMHPAHPAGNKRKSGKPGSSHPNHPQKTATWSKASDQHSTVPGNRPKAHGRRPTVNRASD